MEIVYVYGNAIISESVRLIVTPYFNYEYR